MIRKLKSSFSRFGKKSVSKMVLMTFILIETKKKNLFQNFIHFERIFQEKISKQDFLLLIFKP
jgi:hypothetical protein